MRKREIQSFTLKLTDLKEYESIRQERITARINLAMQNMMGETSTTTATSTTQQPSPTVKYGPKTKEELRQRVFGNLE